MTGAAFLIGKGVEVVLALFGLAIALDTLVAWVIRKWRERAWSGRK